MNLAVIPARGGSKRIPRKNILPFCGKPMIVWSIEAAIRSDCFQRIVVSTDDEEIADIARRHGAEVPFMRPATLADDFTSTQTVVAHAVQTLALDKADLTCCIYATAPFVAAEDLLRGLHVLQDTGADYAFSVTSYAAPIQRAIRVTDDGRVEMIEPEYFYTRSQDLEEAWHDAGQFYWGTSSAWLVDKPLYSPAAAAIILPRYRVQDIDTHEDWERAECLFMIMQTTQSSTT